MYGYYYIIETKKGQPIFLMTFQWNWPTASRNMVCRLLPGTAPHLTCWYFGKWYTSSLVFITVRGKLQATLVDLYNTTQYDTVLRTWEEGLVVLLGIYRLEFIKWFHFTNKIESKIYRKHALNPPPQCRTYASTNQVSIGSDNSLSLIRRQANMEPNVLDYWIIVKWTLRTKFIEVLIRIQNVPFNKMHQKISSAKLCPFCPEGGGWVQRLCWSYLWWKVSRIKRFYRSGAQHDEIEGQYQLSSKLIGILTVLRCIIGANLEILTWTGGAWSRGQFWRF